MSVFWARLLIRAGLARLLPHGIAAWAGGSAALRRYSDDLLNCPHDLVPDLVRSLEPLAPDAIDLASGVPLLPGLTTQVRQTMNDHQPWPPLEGMSELRGRVAELLQAEQGLRVDPAEEVLITAGVSGALHLALEALVNRGDRVVVFDPSSPLYRLAVERRRARVRWLDAWTEQGRLRFRLAQLAKLLRGAKLFVIDQPSNPQGGVIAPEDLEQIAWWADRYDVLLVHDAAFWRSSGPAPVSLATLPRAAQRTLTLGGLSKSHGQPSLRVGWLAGSRPLVRACLVAAGLRQAFVPPLCQLLAAQTLREVPAAHTAYWNDLPARRRYVFERLQGMHLNAAEPAGGFFYWTPIWELGMCGRAFAGRLIQSLGVRVVPGEVFGPSGAGYVRISCGSDPGRLREGLNRLSAFLAEERGEKATLCETPVAA
jgi:aminotransferase